MNLENVTHRDAPSGRWIWLLPLAYTLHMVEGVCHVAANAAMEYYVPGMWTGVAVYRARG